MATIGCVLCGIVISLLLYWFFQKHRGSTYVFEVLNGLKHWGLIISAAATIVLLALFGTKSLQLNNVVSMLNWAALFIFLVILLILRKWKINPIIIMLISGVTGLIFYL